LCFTSCDEIGIILGHLPTQQISAVDENAFFHADDVIRTYLNHWD